MKKRNNPIIDDLLIRYLADEVTEAERSAVEKWLAESEANQHTLAGYRTIFEESKALKPGGFGDADKAWERFKQRIDEQEETGTSSYPFKKWLSIAAGILVVLSFGIWLSLRETPTVNFYAKDQPLVDSLPDGSLISLSSHSSLAFKPGRVREATLKGEAFFEVEHDAARPFRIHVNDLVVNVLGTSFNIKSIGNETEIMVRSGVVGISGENQSTQLQAGERLLVTPGKNWNKQAQTDFNIDNYPGLVQAILKNPKKWPELLKYYTPKPDTSTVAGKNKALVRAIIHQFITEGIATVGDIKTFRLDGSRLIINGIVQPDAIHQRYKAEYLPSQDYFIYFGNERPMGKGIVVSPDHF